MGEKIAFTALAEHGGFLGPHSTDRDVIFNKNITKIGEGYDNTSGYFTAPVPGLYYFTFTYNGGSTSKTGLQLIKSDNLVIQSFDNTEKSSSTSDNAGHSAFLHLNKGDQVFVRLPAGRQVWAADNSTSFSGFLVSRG